LLPHTEHTMAFRLFAFPALRPNVSVLRVLSKQNGAVALFHSGRVLGLQPTSSVRAETNSTTVSFPPPSHVQGSYHWDFERFLSIVLVPLTTLQLTTGSHPITDLLVGVVLPLHCHIGVDAAITDYFPAHRSPVLNRVFTWLLRLGTVGVLVGCYQFNTNDVGMTEVIKRAWKA